MRIVNGRRMKSNDLKKVYANIERISFKSLFIKYEMFLDDRSERRRKRVVLVSRSQCTGNRPFLLSMEEE